ncbi:GntR family transcriptional regulator [Dactylosporangium sp. CA-139066]|uniref:GntR family transcriptional regulator n=1 Tax=Dactylosporangium sp. CA-139066 TaxID=3239930 RepID=UPI003D8A94A5
MSPKYAEIVVALQKRIDREFYAVGDLLPSEAELTQEFGTSRSTVVRALRYLRQQGWLRGVQGKGRIILGRPAASLVGLPVRARYLLQADQHASLVGVRRLSASPRIAGALHLPTGTTLVAGRYLLTSDEAKPIGMSTVFVPALLTDTVSVSCEGGLVPYIERRNGITAHRVIERVGARTATEAETATLALRGHPSVAVCLITVLDAASSPFLVVDAVLTRDSPETLAIYDL